MFMSHTQLMLVEKQRQIQEESDVFREQMCQQKRFEKTTLASKLSAWCGMKLIHAGQKMVSYSSS